MVLDKVEELQLSTESSEDVIGDGHSRIEAEAVPNCSEITKMLSMIEAVAYKCNLEEASMYLRKAKKDFIGARERSKCTAANQTVINDFFPEKFS